MIALLSLPLTALPTAAGDLLVDFNSTNQNDGPHLQGGYQAYDAGHEVSADFIGVRSYAAFGTSVSLQVTWPDTTDNNVRQMIDRSASIDENWTGQKLDLLTDWIGTDTRSGRGNYDGTTGFPTRLVFRFTGLPAGTYAYRSYHHDTENIHTAFQVDLSTDGGASYAPVEGSYRITNSSSGGNPPAPQIYRGTDNQDPADLPSTVNFNVLAQQGQDVLFRYTPLADPEGVHVQFMVVNGLELRNITPASAPTDIQLSQTAVSRTAVEGTEVAQLSTTDPTPDDTFIYTLVEGDGSDGNGNFIIEDDALVVERQLSDHQTGELLSVRIRSTDAAGQWIEKTFGLLVINDSDGDSLDDEWELSFFGNLNQGSGDDPDNDGLTNGEELAAGTSPILADTDGDGLSDGDEILSHFTDPLNPDTDGDGLSDGDEIHIHNTDPLLADSDGDGYDDALEISEGTDPNDKKDFPSILLPLRINEFLASNGTGLRDGNNQREDWIEIYNPNAQPVDLAGYRLTDSASNLAKWTFPATSIAANGYLVVFASGNNAPDPAGNLHTNFSLSLSGEYLALVRPDGTIDDQFPPGFPSQYRDVSYGRHPTNGSIRFFSPSTPGSANGSGFDGVVEPPLFSVGRGFYDSPFEITLGSSTPGAEIRFTTDGSKPTPTEGNLYTGDLLPITTTSRLRAIAYRPGWLTQAVQTHSYMFVDHVAQQPADPPGWPTDWGYSSDAGAIVPSDYEMDPRVVDNTLPGYGIRDALLDIPSVSVNMPMDDFITPPNGIYADPLARIEKECSIEYLLPDGSPGFQTDCKIEVHGNASRRPARMQKHSLRLTFSSAVGPPKLQYPLFPDSPVSTFNKLVLRACFTDSWGLVSWASTRYRPNDSQYIRDVWMKRSFEAMGQPSSYGRFVHLYVNGLYFGLHDLTDRLEDHFFADHLGGEEEHWEVNKDFTTGSPRWSQMMDVAASPDITTPAGYEAVKDYVDLENFADYMLLHFYADAEDWPHKNGDAAVNAISGDGKFRFFVWDQEIALDKFSWNRYNTNPGNNSPGRLFQRLRLNAEFRLLFADRVRRHLFNGGALSLEGSTSRYLALAGKIDRAIVAESARWGDVQATTPYGSTVQQPSPLDNRDHDAYPPAPHADDPGGIYFTRENSWIEERDNVVDHHIPIIHSTTDSRGLIQELRANNLYPPLDAPVFSQHGGVLPPPETLTIRAAGATIFYTLDHSDPRNSVDGSPSPSSATYSSPFTLPTAVTVKSRARLANGSWSALTEASFQPEPSVPEFIPGGDGLWAEDGNWTHPPFPNAIDARALIPAPAVADRNIDLADPITLGEVTFENGATALRTRIQALVPEHLLRFETSGGNAFIRVNGTGTGWAEFESAAGAFLASSLTLEINTIVGSPDFGGLRLRSYWNGPGGLIKTGPGLASLTGSGKLYTGATLVSEGVLQVTQPASMSQTASVTVDPGGQLRLTSAGPFHDPRIHTFGGPLRLDGEGRAIVGPGSLGALRYEPGSGANRAIVTNPIEVLGPSRLHVEGSGNQLDLAGPLEGGSGWTKSGGGTLRLAANSPDYSPAIHVENGKLDLAAAIGSPIELATPATLGGSGSSGALSGSGTLHLDGDLLRASSLTGLHARFVLSAGSLGTLVTSPLAAPLPSIHFYLGGSTPAPSDRIQGGLILPPGSPWSVALIDSSPQVFILDPLGTHSFDGRTWSLAEDARLTRAAITSDLGEGPVPAEVLEIRLDGIATHFAAWQAENFFPDELQDPAISGENSNPSGDGIPNLLRYALGATGDAPAQPLLPQLKKVGDSFTFHFPYDPARFDLIYQVQASDDLTDWTEPLTLFDSSTSALQSDVGGWLEINDTAPPPGQRFYRLRVTRPGF